MPTANNSRRGSALLTVLWLTAALSAVGLAVAANVRGETERAATGLDDARSYFIARGAIERAAMHILWGPTYRTPDGEPIFFQQGQPAMDLDFPGAVVHVDVIPETSKLNLNNILPEELLGLLVALGQRDDRATAIATAILDWKTPVSPEHPSPFDAFYLEQSPSFLPRHASFLENEELLLVRGVTRELYYGQALGATSGALRDCVSVFGSSAVDINTAQPATLQAIGLSPEDAAEIIRTRAERPILKYEQMAQIQQQLGPVGGRLRLGGNTMFTLRATARLKLPDGKLSDMRRSVGALVKLNFPGNTENRQTGFEVLRWYDRY